MSKRLPVLNTLGRSISQPLVNLGRDMASPLHIARLRSARVPPFVASPRAIVLKPKKAAAPYLAGSFHFKGHQFETGQGGNPWSLAVPSEGFADYLHRFDWMDDLAADSGTASQIRAQYLVDGWISVYGKWNDFAWAPDITAQRLSAWLRHWRALLKSDDAASALRRANIYRQLSHLRKSLRQLSAGAPQITACTVLAMAGAMMNNQAHLDRNLDRLDAHLDTQILADGGHISRQPGEIITLLKSLLALESTLAARGIEGSRQTSRAIDRLGAALLFFTHADDKLASFHGSGEGDARAIKSLIKAAGIKAKSFSYMPHSGYQRLEQNGTVMIMDTGDSPPRPYDQNAHLAPLAFELSVPAGRMIVNCGFNRAQPEGWQSVMRQTAAHSTLIIDDCSAGAIIDSRLYGQPISKNAGPAKAQRKELEDAIWLESTHDGYRDDTGLVHRRRIYMDMLGTDIRGEDSLSVPIGHTPLISHSSFAFALRFHVHPDVRLTLARDLKSALLILANGDGWRFRCDNGPIKIEKSVYLGRGYKPERCEQIVVHGDALSDNNGDDRSNRVRWSFKRLGKVGEQ